MEPDELEARLSAAERDASAALVLARAVDRDVAEVRDFRRAVVRSFNALRTEMNERFAAVYRLFGDVERRLEGMDLRLEGMELRLEGMDRRLEGVDRRLEGVDLRLEGVGRRFDQVDQRFSEVGLEFAKIDRGFTEMRGRLDSAAAGQQQIVGLLQTLIADSDRRPDGSG